MEDRSPSAPRDLREWIARVEAIGQLTRIREEVDWNEEMGAITYMAHQTLGAATKFSLAPQASPRPDGAGRGDRAGTLPSRRASSSLA